MPRGWCPGVFSPMPAADGLLVRVKPRASRLSATQARALAAAVAAHGNGRIELTCRANLQVRGLTAAGVERFAGAVVACGLADPDPRVERRRNIVAAPADDAVLAERLERALAGSGLDLPDKFGFAVDLAGTGADVLLRTAGVRLGGGVLQAEAVDPVAAALALARAFLMLGGVRRMRDLLAARGEAAVWQAAGLQPVPAPPWVPDGPPARDIVAAGELDPAGLRAAADRAPDGVLWVTPERRLLCRAASIARRAA